MNIKTQVKDNNEEVYSHVSKYGYFEVFNTHSKNLNNANNKKNTKIENKICFSIVETIIVDNGQYSLWFFTEAERGLVLKRSSKKLLKEYILMYFIRQIVIHLKTFYSIKIDKKEKEILNDLNDYIIFSEQKYSNTSYPGEFSYLEDINKIQFVYLKCHDNIDHFYNILDFIKFINDTNKFGNLILIQNLININQSCKPLTVHYSKKNYLSPKKYNIYTVKPTVDNFIKQISRDDKDEDENKKKKEDYFETLILLNNTILLEEIEKKCENFLKFIEKQHQFNIVDYIIKLMKSVDGGYYFVWGERLKFKKKESNIQGNTISNFPVLNNFEQDNKDPKSCFGEFCEFNVPKFFKNLKKNQKTEDLIRNNLKEEKNKIKIQNLPFLVPVIMVKRAYDNPNLVDLVLKAYSIFPPGFETDKNSEGKKIVLYIPKKNKFSVLNPDFLYSKRYVCNNCYVIYLLIHNFLSNIDENTSSCNINHKFS